MRAHGHGDEEQEDDAGLHQRPKQQHQYEGQGAEHHGEPVPRQARGSRAQKSFYGWQRAPRASVMNAPPIYRRVRIALVQHPCHLGRLSVTNTINKARLTMGYLPLRSLKPDARLLGRHCVSNQRGGHGSKCVI